MTRGSVEITWELNREQNKVIIESYESPSGESYSLGEFDFDNEWDKMKEKIADEIASWILLRADEPDDDEENADDGEDS